MARIIANPPVPSLTSVIKGVYHVEAARRQPFGVTLRFLAWQAQHRLRGRPLRFRTVTGTSLTLLPGASDSLSGFWYHQLPDFEELVFALHLLRPGELFVDVGANQGGWTMTVAGAGTRVIAFEPVPITRQRLLANLASNDAGIQGRVRVLPVGLAETAGPATFSADLDAGNHRIRAGLNPPANTITVDLERADAALRDEDPTLIKIDVEGEELGVLRGARTILSKASLQALVIETFRPDNFAEPSLVAAEALLAEYGFLPMAYDPWQRELRPLREPSAGAQNTIYVRDFRSVQGRLKQSAAITALGTGI